jgi:hypothetical protein
LEWFQIANDSSDEYTRKKIISVRDIMVLCPIGNIEAFCLKGY